MYEEYLIALKKIRRYKRKLQKKLSKTKLTKELIEHRNIIYETEKGIVETIISIERYLPQERRTFTNKYNYIKETKLQINSNVINQETLEEIVSNKELRKQLLSILEEELSEQQLKVIILFYSKNYTKDMIAKELGINKRKINIYLKNAYGKLLVSKNIKEFLKNMVQN